LIFYFKLVFCNRPVDIINAVNDIPSTITAFHAGYSVKYTCLTGYVGYDETNKNEIIDFFFVSFIGMVQQHLNVLF
jgi:hypothetical protein